MRPCPNILLILCLAVSVPAAASDDGPAEVEAPSEVQPVPGGLPQLIHRSALSVRDADRLGYRLWIDAPITVVTWSFWIGTEAFKPQVAPSRCNWCEPNALDWSVRNALVWEDTGRAQHASDVLLFGAAPAAALVTTLALAGGEGKLEETPWDALLILEAAGVAAALNQSVKLVIGRERPFAHALPEAQKGLTDHPEDNNLSFYSGHATVTFALAASTATVAHMRGRKGAGWAWAVGMPVAAATAYLRLAGDKHYLTDVAVGAAAGTAIGILVPAAHDWLAFRTGGEQRTRNGRSGVTTSAAFVPVRGGGVGTISVRW